MRSSDDDIVSFEGSDIESEKITNIPTKSQDNEIFQKIDADTCISTDENESSDDNIDPDYQPSNAKNANSRKKPPQKKKRKRGGNGNFGRKSKGAKNKKKQR